jgi:RNA polymerase sigma-70 factor (ECF subfamily)
MTENVQQFSVAALQAGDRNEFARMVDAFTPKLYRLAIKMLGNEQDAEDIVQNTFLKAFQHLRGFESRSSLSTWLYRIAANEALMLLRRKRPETTFSDALPEDEGQSAEYEPAEFSDWCCLPEEEFVSSEARLALDQGIQTLSENLRIVFLLRDIEGLSIQETGEALGLTETTVKTRLLRARLRLREQLSQFYSERMHRNVETK